MLQCQRGHLMGRRQVRSKKLRIPLSPSAPAMPVEPAADMFGKEGSTVQVVCNHFVLRIEAPEPWCAWQVQMDLVGAPRRGEKERTPPMTVGMRQAAMKNLLQDRQDLNAADWCYDGDLRLYTRTATVQVIRSSSTSTVQLRNAQIQVKITEVKDPNGKHQELDLQRLDTEELRFIHVAMKQDSHGDEERVVVGQKVVCPKLQLACMTERSLLYGREVWMGYMAMVQLVQSRRGRTPTLLLNLVSSVGLPEMPAIELLAHFLRGKWTNKEWIEYLGQGHGERDVQGIIDTLNGPLGMRGLRVQYQGKKKIVSGITQKPARHLWFSHAEYGNVSVQEYFLKKYNTELKYPHLPCLQWGQSCVPMELVTILGGQHNIEAGKQRPEYQAALARMTLSPHDWLQEIQSLCQNQRFGPQTSLHNLGLEVTLEPMMVIGRVLPAPGLQAKNSSLLEPNSYAREVQAIAPPKFQVSWGVWCFASQGQQSDLDWFLEEWQRKGQHHGINFAPKPYPKLWGHLVEEEDQVKDMISKLLQDHKRPKLLLVLLPGKGNTFYPCLKTLADTVPGFATQCMLCQGKRDQTQFQALSSKLDNVLLKVVNKLPSTKDAGAAHSVELAQPHRILSSKTMVIGADVTHGCGGLSVAGVVGSCDGSFASYFAIPRAQSPFALNGEKRRSRRSEERIVEFEDMVQDLLQLWKRDNGSFPENILYYRDGVSNGQFSQVLNYEMAAMDKAFQKFDIRPKLLVLVCQKRHQTRFWKKTDSSSCKGKGKGKNCKGKSVEGQYENVPPGFVADEGIAATSGFPNFYLVAHKGLKGTCRPCHCSVLHNDLSLNMDDVQRITYEPWPTAYKLLLNIGVFCPFSFFGSCSDE
ncbi:unnamed protein product [Durusdinium trenchii]|uniref:Uncharacterized protein n=1 Tax=Durusdinium trenchii TaxID=1381693 RepID=A0ABP0RVD0_9DINO